ncbi:MAG TPA: TolC family protein, partial [Bacteroidetes bacterium]|nr:TolC family protein [Bacteroidota bacterium]HEX04647.1 TolC family protein [Bacteroidota bacterium]
MRRTSLAHGFRFHVFISVVTLLLLTVISNAETESRSIVPEDAVLSQLLVEATAANPSLEALRERLAAAEARIPQAGSWMDPKLTFGAMNLPTDNLFDLNQEPMTGLWINASQSIPLNRKYESKRDVAEAMMDATRESVGLKTTTVLETVRGAWYDWAYLRESVATVDTTIRLIDELLVITRTKYETGRGLQSDWLRLQTERSRLASQRIQLEQMARNAGRKVAVFLGREADALPPPPNGLPVQFTAIDAEALSDAANRAPQIRVAEQMVRAGDAKIDLSKQLWIPELMLSGGYGFRQDADNGMSRADFVTISAGMTLPIFGGSKQSMKVQEAVAEKRSAQHTLRQAQLDVGRKVESLLDEDLRHSEQIQLYNEGVLPQAGAALSSTLSDYSVGRVGVEALVSSERDLINYRLQRLMHLRDRA